jgi:hypothetical protein
MARDITAPELNRKTRDHAPVLGLGFCAVEILEAESLIPKEANESSNPTGGPDKIDGPGLIVLIVLDLWILAGENI